MKLLSALSVLFPLAALAAGPVNIVDVRALHLRMAPPEGWKLNDSMSKDGWVSLYWMEAKDPAESSIDVFFYEKSAPLGSQERYLAKLKRDPRLKNLAVKTEKLKTRDAAVATGDSERTVGAYTTKAKRAPFRETYLILGRPDGIVVLHLQATKALNKKQETVLRRLAESVQSL